MEETNISGCLLLYSGPLPYILLENIKAISILNYDKYCNVIYIELLPHDNETAVAGKTPSNLCPMRAFLNR
jgi:hypothetical protein